MQFRAPDAGKFVRVPVGSGCGLLCFGSFFVERVNHKGMRTYRKTVGEGCLRDVVPAQKGIDAPESFTVFCQYNIKQSFFLPELNACHRVYTVLFTASDKLRNGCSIVDVSQCDLPHPASQCCIHQLLRRQGAVAQTVICMAV